MLIRCSEQVILFERGSNMELRNSNHSQLSAPRDVKSLSDEKENYNNSMNKNERQQISSQRYEQREMDSLKKNINKDILKD